MPNILVIQLFIRIIHFINEISFLVIDRKRKYSEDSFTIRIDTCMVNLISEHSPTGVINKREREFLSTHAHVCLPLKKYPFFYFKIFIFEPTQ
jgi:hypothetical protein